MPSWTFAVAQKLMDQCKICDQTEVKGGMTPLMRAARLGHLECVRELTSSRSAWSLNLELVCESTDRSMRGMTALHFAASRPICAVPIITALVRAKADINAVDHLGRGALHHAANAGNARTFRALIEMGARLGPTLLGETVLHVTPSLGVVGAAILVGVDVHAVTNILRQTALHRAARAGRTSALTALIAARADIEAQDVNGNRPLHFAAGIGLTGCAKMLIALGAELSPANSRGETPLHAAARTGLDTVRLLLLRGASINPTSYQGVTPMYYAAESKDDSMLIELLKHGASPHAADRRTFRFLGKKSPLHAAVVNGRVGSVERLLSFGADPREQNELGESAVFVAARRPTRHEILVLLLRHTTDRGALECRFGRCGHTPLMAAAASGNHRGIAALTRAGASVDRTDANGRTPLIIALRSRQSDTRELRVRCALQLLSAGARANIVDQNGSSALHAAVWLNAHSLIHPLIWAGADPHARDIHGATPALVAARRVERLPCLEILLRVPRISGHGLFGKWDRDAMIKIAHEAEKCTRMSEILLQSWTVQARELLLPGYVLGLPECVASDIFRWAHAEKLEHAELCQLA